MSDGGEAVVSAYEAIGADYIFSSPGSEWAPVWEALARRERDGVPSPTYLDLMHETVAVAMATGYGLVTRRPQGVLLHAGPGLLQGAMAIHGALLAGVPMVVSSSESITYGDAGGTDPGGQWYRNLSVVGGPHGLAAPFVKWSNQAASVATLHQMITRAGELAMRPSPGPTYLNVPVEVLLEPWQRPDVPLRIAGMGATVSAEHDIERVAALLANAERPVIVTESVGRHHDGLAALLDLAEALDVPVVEPAATVCTNFPRGHRLHAGDAVEPFIDTADLIVLVDCRAPFYPPSRRPAHAAVVVIDEAPQRHHMAYQVLHADHYLEGGTVATMRALAARASELSPAAATAARREWGRSAGATHADAVAVAEQRARGADGIDPIALTVALRDLLAADDPMIVDETITHGSVVKRHGGRTTADSYFYVQGGLGQGIAVALGAKLAAPGRPVVLTIGDGSFLYNPIVQSFDASKLYGIPILVVIYNNHEYRSMKMNHLRFYPEGAAVATGRFRGVDLSHQPALSAFCEPFGMHAESVTARDELTPALERALQSVRNGVTAVVDVTVSR
jgi:thiamine pyrophosphate-dependent acetolactate synthase large subunit-like protein